MLSKSRWFRDVSRELSKPEYHDVTISCKDGEFMCNSIVIKSRNSYCSASLSFAGNNNIIEIPHTVNMTLKMFDVITSCKFPTLSEMKIEEIKQLYDMGEMYLVSELTERISRYLKNDAPPYNYDEIIEANFSKSVTTRIKQLKLLRQAFY